MTRFHIHGHSRLPVPAATLGPLVLPGLLSAPRAVPEIPLDSTPNFLNLTDKTPLGLDTLHSIATDAECNVYVGDRGDREFKTQYMNVCVPWAICISPGAHRYLFSSNSNDT